MDRLGTFDIQEFHLVMTKQPNSLVGDASIQNEILKSHAEWQLLLLDFRIRNGLATQISWKAQETVPQVR